MKRFLVFLFSVHPETGDFTRDRKNRGLAIGVNTVLAGLSNACTIIIEVNQANLNTLILSIYAVIFICSLITMC